MSRDLNDVKSHGRTFQAECGQCGKMAIKKDSVTATQGAGRRKIRGEVGEGKRGEFLRIVSARVRSVHLIAHEMEFHQHILE